MDYEALRTLLSDQDGVISRRQVRACQGGDHDIRRILRRREWAVVHEGVYVDHTGVLTWRQRAWAAVLYAGPKAALDRESAIRAYVGPGWRGVQDDDPIQVAVDAKRTVVDVAGVRVRRVAHLESKVHWSASPPRLRIEEATIDYALTRARQRAHDLPPSRRQHHETRSGGRALYRDVHYEGLGVDVELDGRAFHSDAGQRDDDLDRDLDLLVEDRASVRLGWGQVFRRSCRTAARMARVLQSRGWDGEPRPCGPDCEIPDAAA